MKKFPLASSTLRICRYDSVDLEDFQGPLDQHPSKTNKKNKNRPLPSRPRSRMDYLDATEEFTEIQA